MSLGHSVTDSMLHQTGQGWEYVNWWIDSSSVHVSINIDLALSDISSKIWNWMSDIIIGHCEDGELGNGSELSINTTGSLIDGGKIRIHVTWVTSSTRHLLSGCRDLSQGIGIGCHICKNGKDVHVFLIGKMLSSGQGESWSNNTLNSGVIGVIHEQDDTVHGAIHLEVVLEETGCLQVDTHCSEDNSEVFFRVIKDIFALDKGGLSTNLGTNIIMRKTSS